MQSLRAFIRDRRRLAILLVALALTMKMMVPSGFMVGAGPGALAITICDGSGHDVTQRLILPRTGQSPESSQDQGKAFEPCPYAALTMAALAGAPAALLAAALAFILSPAAWPSATAEPAPRAFLRPPPRAPPPPR